VQRAVAWVEAQRSWIHPVAALAREAGLSSAALHARFVAEIGLSPAAWMRRRRLDEAQRLLSGTGLGITAIAQRLGFRSSQHFATQFRLAVGVPPQRWRARAGAGA
jgi:transcriptional regulator GlxA family with amidase domain